MLIKKHKILKVSFVLTFILSLTMLGQEANTFKVFDNYRSYSFEVTPVFFQKASVKRYYGTYELNNHSDFNLQYSIKKYFRKEKEWSYFAGLSLNITPSANYSFILKSYDIPFEEDDYFTPFVKEGHRYLSFLLGVENKMQISNKIFFNSNLSININYLQHGSIYSSYHISDEETQTTRENFALWISTQDNEIQGSASISAGFYFPLKYFLLKTDIVYNKTFQNVFEGEYQFGNLFISEPTKGAYKASGDYIGLSIAFSFKKSKKSLIKRIQ